MITGASKISSQPEVDFEGPEAVVSPRLAAAVAFLIAWLALGFYAVDHPDVQKHFTRFVQMSAEEDLYFQLRMGLLALPIHPAILALIGAILVWIAFLRAEWSDRLLFCAASILSATAIVGGTEYAFYAAFHQWYGSTMVSAGVVTYTLCLLLAHRTRSGVFSVLSILAITYGLVLPYYAMYASVLDILGGVLFGGAVLCAAFYMAERAGVRPFAATD